MHPIKNAHFEKQLRNERASKRTLDGIDTDKVEMYHVQFLKFEITAGEIRVPLVFAQL